MKKVLNWIKNNPFLIISIFILTFIPLYPKVPLLDIQHTWVNIRIEDFLIAASFLFFAVMWLRKRATIKTPLTIPIVAFWVVGLVSTVYAILFIFPNLINAFPQLAVLHYLRRIEYIGVFFIAYNAIKDTKALNWVIAALAIVTLTVVFYGLGQRLWEFPAFLTGNEEFSKGIPLTLGPNSRIPSTFAGHYDLSAFLVLVIPIFLGVMLAVKKWWLRIALFTTSMLGYILLLMTASRVSFGAFLVSLATLLFFTKKRLWIIPALIAAILVSTLFDGMTERFGKTISQVDLVVDARTGETVGVAEKGGSEGEVVVEDKQAEGDELDTGSSYINIRGDRQQKATTREITYKRSVIGADGEEESIATIEGDFIVKKGFAYDVSFTTRFQGTWPRAIEAFDRNPISGGGYSTISLASDNNYLRILGETGIAGLISFASIFVVFGIYLYRVLPSVTSKKAKFFALGVGSGVVGLALNATLIDVFEASKVAFVLWTLLGLTVGILHMYQKKSVQVLPDLKRLITSYPVILLVLTIASIWIFRPIMGNFFIANDFTWLRWADECKTVVLEGAEQCEPFTTTVAGYFTDADGFFYRPGTKTVINAIYSVFSLDAQKYHLAQIFLHAASAFGVFLIAARLIKSRLYSFLAAATFLTLAIHYESVFWISALGHMISFAAILYSIALYMYAQGRRKYIYILCSLILAAIAPLFHELGVVAPVLIVAYEAFFGQRLWQRKNAVLLAYLLVIPVYIYMRNEAGSHWSGGDYSYNLAVLPFNVIGNALGYMIATFAGPQFLDSYAWLRGAMRENVELAILSIGAATAVIILVLYRAKAYVFSSTGKIYLFLLIFFVISLAPFLALGNISPRYDYVAAAPLVIAVGLALKLITDSVAKSKQKYIAGLFIALTAIFATWNIMQLQSLARQWQHTSEISKSLVLGFYEQFPQEEYEFKNERTFYFVDVPIKINSAWVFPTGVEDALYFALDTENVTVERREEVTEELQELVKGDYTRVFIFRENGRIEEVIREVEEVPVNE